ncbi:MAG: polysaccharide pyruvyl transferase family protein [Pseudomonadota bacterium]
MKVVLVNVKFSPNLGDGVIAECLEDGLRSRIADIEIANCDLAGRTRFGPGSAMARTIALSALHSLSDGVKKAAYEPLLAAFVRRRLMPVYAKTIDSADAVVFGGGQLLEDADLNFPMKVAAAAGVARERDIPMAVFAVGVGRTWSERGAALFNEAFAGAELAAASVRDQLSQTRWRRHFSKTDVEDAQIAFDPGLLARKTYGAVSDEERTGRNRPKIGLCVTHPTTLRTHYDGGDAPSAEADTEFFRSLARDLAARGMEIVLFTNGAPDDRAFLRRCFPATVLAGFDKDQIALAPESRRPSDLVAIIRDCDGVIAHRLHANIIAYSYAIPHVGLAMNSKLSEFFALTGRPDFAVGPEQFKADIVGDKMASALNAPIETDQHAAILRKADADLDALADSIRRAARARRMNGDVR